MSKGSDRICGITCYFNLSKSKERFRNFATFRARWQECGLPLLVIEWSPWGNFELNDPTVHQISGGALIWQKERLFSIGSEIASSLGYEKFIYTDADMLYPEGGKWASGISDMLDDYDAIQCFDNAICHYNDKTAVGPSVVKRYQVDDTFVGGSPGGVWAFNQKFALCGGWYDENLVGGGDSCLAYALLADVPDEPDRNISRSHHMLQATPETQWLHFVKYHKKIQRLKPKTTYLEGVDVDVMVHGTYVGRKFGQRFKYFEGYTPDLHTFKLPGRPVQWQAQAPELLQNNLARYFFERGYDEGFCDGIMQEQDNNK